MKRLPTIFLACLLPLCAVAQSDTKAVRSTLGGVSNHIAIFDTVGSPSGRYVKDSGYDITILGSASNSWDWVTANSNFVSIVTQNWYWATNTIVWMSNGFVNVSNSWYGSVAFRVTADNTNLWTTAAISWTNWAAGGWTNIFGPNTNAISNGKTNALTDDGWVDIATLLGGGTLPDLTWTNAVVGSATGFLHFVEGGWTNIFGANTNAINDGKTNALTDDGWVDIAALLGGTGGPEVDPVALTNDVQRSQTNGWHTGPHDNLNPTNFVLKPQTAPAPERGAIYFRNSNNSYYISPDGDEWVGMGDKFMGGAGLVFSNTMTVGEMQAEIDDVPKFLGGRTLSIKFNPGTYEGFTQSLEIAGFSAGFILVQSTNNVYAARTNHVTILDASTNSISQLFNVHDNACTVQFYSLAMRCNSTNGMRGILGARVDSVSAGDCYFMGNGVSDGDGFYISDAGRSVSWVNAFSGWQNAMMAENASILSVNNCQATNVTPSVGLYMGGSTAYVLGSQVLGTTQVYKSGGGQVSSAESMWSSDYSLSYCGYPKLTLTTNMVTSSVSAQTPIPITNFVHAFDNDFATSAGGSAYNADSHAYMIDLGQTYSGFVFISLSHDSGAVVTRATLGYGNNVTLSSGLASADASLSNPTQNPMLYDAAAAAVTNLVIRPFVGRYITLETYTGAANGTYWINDWSVWGTAGGFSEYGGVP